MEAGVELVGAEMIGAEVGGVSVVGGLLLFGWSDLSYGWSNIRISGNGGFFGVGRE